MKKKLQKLLLLAATMLVGTNAWAYDTPDGYKVGTVYVGQKVNNQVLAETFANYAVNTSLTSLSTNWSTNVTGTTGYFWAKIDNTVRTVAYPATDQATLYTCNKYTATKDGENNKTVYSNDNGTTYYSGKDFQTVFDATDWNISSDGTDYQVPSYVYGKCISIQHRDKKAPCLDYKLTTAVSSGKLVFGADIYRIQNANAPVYIQFLDSEDNRIFQIYYENGGGRKTMMYQVGSDSPVGGAGYSEYRVYRGWGIKDMVFDMDAGTVSYKVDNVHWDSSNPANRRTVSQPAINIGTGKEIAKVRFTSNEGSSKTNYDLFIDNMYLYTLEEGTATTDDVTIIGSRDYEDGYLGSTSDDYTIKPNGKLHLQFKNYGSGAYGWNNWIALFNNADKTSNLAYVRADTWDIVSSSNTGITTSSNYWDAFESDMYGSTVDMDITRTDGNVNMVATITTTTSKVMTLTFDKAIGTATEDIVFRLSEDGACLVLDNTKTAIVAPPTFAQTSITNTGNPIITITENIGDSPTSSSAIYYTTNNTNPTTSSESYTNPVAVTGGNTIKAITIVTATDGTTTLTSNVGSLTTTAYVAAQIYDLTVPTYVDIIAEGFGNRKGDINYGLGATSRYHKSAGSDGIIIMDGLLMSGNSTGTDWYWMTGQGLWQSGGTRTVTLNNTIDGEVALFTLCDCRYDGTNWTFYTESENYKSNCSFSLNKSNNTATEGNHVYMVKKVKSFVPVGTTVSMIISASGWTSCCSPYALDFTNIDGLTAYYVEDATTGSSSISLKKVEGTVAAGTGLVLKGTASTEYSVPVVAGGTDLSATNKLTGVLANTVIDQNFAGYENIYVLSSGQFQNVNTWIAGGNTVTIPAGKSYLTADAAAVKALNAFINGEATGIESVATESNLFDGATYNLAGQRVSNGYKGIVIRNGKKYLVK